MVGCEKGSCVAEVKAISGSLERCAVSVRAGQ